MNDGLSVVIPSYDRFDNLNHTLDVLTNLAKSSLHTDKIEFCVSLNSYKTENYKFLSNKFRKVRFKRTKKILDYDSNVLNAVTIANKTHIWILSDDDEYDKINFDEILKIVLKNYDYIFVNYMVSTECKLKSSRFSNFLFFIDGNTSISMSNSFIGSNIYKKSLFLSCPKDIFVGTHYIHMGISYYIMDRSSNLFIIKKPQITQVSPPYKISRIKSGVHLYYEALKGAIIINKLRQNRISKFYNLFILSDRVCWQTSNLLSDRNYKLCMSLWLYFFRSVPILFNFFSFFWIIRFLYYFVLINLKKLRC